MSRRYTGKVHIEIRTEALLNGLEGYVFGRGIKYDSGVRKVLPFLPNRLDFGP